MILNTGMQRDMALQFLKPKIRKKRQGWLWGESRESGAEPQERYIPPKPPTTQPTQRGQKILIGTTTSPVLTTEDPPNACRYALMPNDVSISVTT